MLYRFAATAASNSKLADNLIYLGVFKKKKDQFSTAVGRRKVLENYQMITSQPREVIAEGHRFRSLRSLDQLNIYSKQISLHQNREDIDHLPMINVQFFVLLTLTNEINKLVRQTQRKD